MPYFWVTAFTGSRTEKVKVIHPHLKKKKEERKVKVANVTSILNTQGPLKGKVSPIPRLFVKRGNLRLLGHELNLPTPHMVSEADSTFGPLIPVSLDASLGFRPFHPFLV